MYKKGINLEKLKLVQIGKMKAEYPSFKNKINSSGNLVFEGTIQPSPTMPIFKVAIEYRGSSSPRVRVLAPTLESNRPHFYKEAGCLCLYKPENFHWTADKLISDYIVSWAISWLYFYEVWRETGEWIGPEAEHNQNTEKHE